jgi:hypothetical protein
MAANTVGVERDRRRRGGTYGEPNGWAYGLPYGFPKLGSGGGGGHIALG